MKKYRNHRDVERILTEEAQVSEPEDVVQFFREKQKGKRRMNKFWDALKESVILQGVITVMVLGLIIFLLATKQEVPEQLWTAFALILGFFFGSKVERARK